MQVVLPKQIGRYTVIREMGRGGMGVVYEAEQAEPRRRVALKVMRDPLASPEIQSRFERESEWLGLLHHPGVAHIYEAGMAEMDGRSIPFFAMEFIDGPALDVHIREAQLDRRSIVELFARVCDAVQHAHQKGLIHRDLKPANVLVKRESTAATASSSGTATMIDSIGQPKVLDFGVARLAAPDAHTTVQTSAGQIIGTLAYMSPEQIEGDAQAVDTRSDVYAIGAMLYQVLAGRMPKEIAGLPFAEAARLIVETPAPMLGTLDATLSGDLETIVAKALEPDRERRYPSAAALGEDLRRYLANEPILARPATAFYQVTKFVRRNRVLVGGLVTSGLVLVLGAAGTAVGLVSALRVKQELANSNRMLEQVNQQLQTANEDLTAVSSFQANQLSTIDVARMGTRIRERLIEQAAEADRDALAVELAKINFTDLSRTALKQNIFDPSLSVVAASFEDQPAVRARLKQGVGIALRELGLLDDAAGPMNESLATLRSTLGELHEDTIDAELGVAMLLHLSGAHGEAREAYERVIELSGDGLKPDHDLALTAKMNLANLIETLGEFGKAGALYAEVLEARRRIAGDEAEVTATALGQVGLNHLYQGQYAESEQRLREAMLIQQGLLGAEDENTLTTQSYLAAALFRLGRLDEAIEVGKAALEGRRRTHGNDHPTTLISVANVGVFLVEAERYDEAEPYYLATLESRKRISGPDHPETITALHNMGFFYVSVKRYEDGERYYRMAVDKASRVLGEEHRSTMQSLQNLATCLARQKRYDEAAQAFVTLIDRRKRASGPDHAETIAAMSQGARMFTWANRLDEADTLINETVAIAREALGDLHPTTLDVLDVLAALLEKQGKLAEAEQVYRELYLGRLKTVDAAHPQVGLVRKYLTRVLEKQGKPVELPELQAEETE